MARMGKNQLGIDALFYNRPVRKKVVRAHFAKYCLLKINYKVPLRLHACSWMTVALSFRSLLVDRIPSTTPGAEPPRDAKDSGSARSHPTHLETSSSNRP